VLLTMALVLPVAAQAADARPTVVALEFSGGEAERKQFTESLAELLGRLGLTLEPAWDKPRLATISADFTAPSEGVLTVKNAVDKVVLLRLIPRGEKPAVALEAAAHIAHSVVEELRDVSLRAPLVARGPSPLPDPELAVEKPRAAVETGGPIGVELGGYANARIWGGGAPFTVGFALQVEVALAVPKLRPALVWSGGYQPPFAVSSNFAQLFAHVVPLRLLAQLTPLRGDDWRLDAALGGGTDIFITAARSTVLPPGSIVNVRADATGVLSAQVLFRLGVARSADLWLGVMADLDLAPRRYVVNVGGTIEEVYQPWRVRPAFLLGFSFAPVGKDPYAGRGEDSP
jgi:hypothetical protein